MVSADNSWELAANAGAELSYKSGAFGVALGLLALFPLSRKPSDPGPVARELPDSISEQWVVRIQTRTPPGAGFGEQLGAELNLRLWVALGS
jgi:hypothetical protein